MSSFISTIADSAAMKKANSSIAPGITAVRYSAMLRGMPAGTNESMDSSFDALEAADEACF